MLTVGKLFSMLLPTTLLSTIDLLFVFLLTTDLPSGISCTDEFVEASGVMSLDWLGFLLLLFPLGLLLVVAGLVLVVTARDNGGLPLALFVLIVLMLGGTLVSGPTTSCPTLGAKFVRTGCGIESAKCSQERCGLVDKGDH
jgi:hypothetical protein